MHNKFTYDKNNDFTIVIVFRNEGNEILNTIKSINNTLSSSQNILLMDDGSNDGYNYENLSNVYSNVKYIKNEHEGVAVQRTNAILNYVETKYWMIIDGHMRFYDYNWPKIIKKIIDKNPNALYCSNTVVLSKENDIIVNEDGKIKKYDISGSIIDFDSDTYKTKWFSTDLIKRETNSIFHKQQLVEIPCILGACYFGTVTHFKKYLNRLHVLKIYGSDEQFLSIINWMAGFKNILVRNFFVGHIYRDNKYLQNNHPYNGTYQLFNCYLIRHIFNNENIFDMIEITKKQYNVKTFNLMMDMYKNNENEIKDTIKQVSTQSKRTFNQYKEYTEEYIKNPNKFLIQ